MTEPNQYAITPDPGASGPEKGDGSSWQAQQDPSAQSQDPQASAPSNESHSAPASGSTSDAGHVFESQTPSYAMPRPQYAAPAETPSYAQQPEQPQYGQPQYSQPGQPQYQAPAPQQGPANPYGQPQYSQQQPYPQGFGPGSPYNATTQQGAGVPPLNKPYYGIPFPEAIKRFFQKYVVFSGRASKSEFWWAFLGYFAVAIVLGMINSITGERMSWLGNLWALATILPGIAIFVRRLHDSDRSGWWAALPIGLGLLTIVFSVIAAVQLFATVGYAIASPAGLSGELAMRNVSGVAVWGLLIMVSVIAILVSFIVLGVAASKPEGARYDDDAKTQQGGYPGEYLQNPQPGQQPYSGQPYGQPYGQPAFGDQTPNVQERNAPYGQSANGQGNGYGNPTN